MNRPAVDLDALSDELRPVVRDRPEDYAPPRIRLRQPDEPQRGFRLPDDQPDPDLGAMTAEAVRKQHEAAAQSVIDMGKQVNDRINALEAALKECHKDMALIAEAANTIRAKGEKVAQQVAEAGQLSVDIRAVCDEFVKKVGA